MRVLVTTGNTHTPIDRVRVITNVFTGRTGGRIAAVAHARGHAVSVLTSHPEVLPELGAPTYSDRWRVQPYRTFDDLADLMAKEVPGGGYDAVVHSAAISDYAVSGVFAGRPDGPDAAAGKVKSHHPELWLKLVPTPKLVDRVRGDWGFGGVLVKFKLEVGVTDAELLEIAERSRRQSAADVMVANTLDGRFDVAFIGVRGGEYRRVTRADLAATLLETVEGLA